MKMKVYASQEHTEENYRVPVSLFLIFLTTWLLRPLTMKVWCCPARKPQPQLRPRARPGCVFLLWPCPLPKLKAGHLLRILTMTLECSGSERGKRKVNPQERGEAGNISE